MATDTITALGAGSGMDVKALAQSLVDAERAPRKDAIDKKVKASEANISGYGALSYVLDGLKTAFSALNDQSDFSIIQTSNSQPNAFSVNASATAAAGSHTVEVTQIATAQRNLSAGFANSTAQLNGGAAFSLSLSVNGGAAQAIEIPTGFTNPMGVVACINATKLATAAVAPVQELQSITISNDATAQVSFLGMPVAGSAALDTPADSADKIIADKANILGGAAAISAGIADIATGATPGTLIITYRGGYSGAGSGDVQPMAAVTARDPAAEQQRISISGTATGEVSFLGVSLLGSHSGDGPDAIGSLILNPTNKAAILGSAENPTQAYAAGIDNIEYDGEGGLLITYKGGYSGSGSGDIAKLVAASSTGIGFSQGVEIQKGDVGVPDWGATFSAGTELTKGVQGRVASTGITAQLINTGDPLAPYKIMVTGATGVANDFTLLSSNGSGAPVSGVSFETRLQSVRDATLVVDGVPITSSSNRIEGAIAGVTLNLTGKTTTSLPASLDFSRDTSSVKTKLEALVTAYNDANSMLGVVSDPKSTVETYGATLVGNSAVQQVRSQMRALITANSSSPSGDVKALRDLGISIDRTGVMVLDAAKLDTALSTKFDNVVTMLSANRENLSSYSSQTAGIAGEAVRKLTKMLASNGILTTQTSSANSRIAEYKKQLDKLEERMTELLARYNKQFGAMQTIVGQSKSLGASLTSTFDGMMAAYTNN